MKKQNIVKALKASSSSSSNVLIECHVENGTAYVTNGYICIVMDPAAHDEIIKPVTGSAAGSYRFAQGKAVPVESKLKSVFEKHVKDVLSRASLLEDPHMTRQEGKTTVAGLYSLVGKFPVVVNACYLAAFPENAMFYAASPTEPVIVTDGMKNIFGLVMPIKPRFDNFQRAVIGYYNAAEDQQAEPASDDSKEWAKDWAEAAEKVAGEWMETAKSLEAERDAIAQEAAALREQLKALQREAETAQAEQEAQPRETVEAIVARFTALPGITATVKGAQTAAPVVWLAGDIEAQADAIKQQGAKWSAKRAAYYFRVA